MNQEEPIIEVVPPTANPDQNPAAEMPPVEGVVPQADMGRVRRQFNYGQMGPVEDRAEPFTTVGGSEKARQDGAEVVKASGLVPIPPTLLPKLNFTPHVREGEPVPTVTSMKEVVPRILSAEANKQ